jgi:hypothetical protein
MEVTEMWEEKLEKMIDYLNALQKVDDSNPRIDCRKRINNVCDEIEKELGIGYKTIGALKVKIDGSEIVETIYKEMGKYENHKI